MSGHNFNPQITWKHKLFWRFCWLIFLFVIVPPARLKPKNFRKVPQKGPLLLLGNHGTWMDPFWLCFFCWRRVHFMATAFFFSHPFLGPFFTMIGAFPKAKFTKDRQSMGYLQSYYDQGEAVALFPEGERSWDGRPLPVLPNIGRLILRMNCPVIFVRILGVHQQHPRWARYPRFTPMYLEYSDPVVFPKDMAPEAITEEVQRRIRVLPEECPPPPRFSFGYRLADGLQNFMWACPHCFKIDALKVYEDDADQIECSSCKARWKLDINQHMHGQTSNLESFSVPNAYDRIVAHYGTPPIADRSRFDRDGIVLESGPCVVRPARGAGRLELAGRLQLLADRLQLQNSQGELTWSVRLVDTTVISVEGSENMTVRLADQLLILNFEKDAIVKWAHFGKAWREKSLAEHTAT